MEYFYNLFWDRKLKMGEVNKYGKKDNWVKCPKTLIYFHTPNTSFFPSIYQTGTPHLHHHHRSDHSSSSLCFFVLHSPAASSGGAPHCHQPSSSSSPLISVSQFHFFLTVQPHLRLLLHFPASDWPVRRRTNGGSFMGKLFLLSFVQPLSFWSFLNASDISSLHGSL